MKRTCELCRNFCSQLLELRLREGGHLLGMIGPCCLQRASERMDRLAERHPDRLRGPMCMAEFRELTRPLRPRSHQPFGRPRREDTGQDG
ncbi:hypothetical protein ARC20_08435 [Stenotrophomonas panacihumi]|uniref:Uncharacterized protein n=1 Tax=Stenotrophomonas panacihumi TaxID=676599 RepID=A0A0R0ATL2_9GAMM|nr:hypothetical protein [Stenotrophomonas panacihumi]KRG44436.1 hypothetical protein ARC20_08435 [Stenotrophomonas panacihumi]PTN54560.1 hypothetical protein C9J98_09995 [Stenotrophomonas panacihumi]